MWRLDIIKKKLRVLYTSFNGKTNSAKILLDKIDSNDKLYLRNSFDGCVKALDKSLKNNDYDLVISFGQWCMGVDTVQLETKAKIEDEYLTKFDYMELRDVLKDEYKVVISTNAGDYLCNYLYYYGLKFIKENNLNTKMLFIHLPKIEKITDIDRLAELFTKYSNND